MNLLILDNYDSFTFNLVHYVEQFCDKVTVIRNDEITLDQVDAFDAIILSPGPGLPKDAGIMPQLIERYAPTKKILGVCLGHQAIAEAFGAKLINLKEVLHGVAVPIQVTEESEPIFRGMPATIKTGRYHSWAVSNNAFPEELTTTAVDAKGNIMAFRHTEYDLSGVQFHPESLLTEHGLKMIENWIRSNSPNISV